MNSLARSSLRLVGRMGVSHRVATRAFAPLARAPLSVRGYASKRTIDAVVNEKQRKQELVRMLDEEANVLKTSLEEADLSATTEVTDRFLKETGFKLEHNKDEAIIRLKKTLQDKTVEITFADAPDDYEPKEEYEDEEGEEEGDKEAEEKEEGEEAETEDSGETREHAFTVELKSTKPGKEETSFLFQCYASSDGSFVVNKLTSAEHIPVQISYWSDDMKRELLTFLDGLSINERLSYFIHQYITRKETEENIKVLEEFREFVRG